MAAVFPFEAESMATAAATLTVTFEPVGVMSTVYVVPEPAKLPAVPFPTVMSPTTKPVTDSENVIVTGMGLTFVVAGAVELIVTVGCVPS